MKEHAGAAAVCRIESAAALDVKHGARMRVDAPTAAADLQSWLYLKCLAQVSRVTRQTWSQKDWSTDVILRTAWQLEQRDGERLRLAEFREWFVQFDAQNWDDQIAANAGAGRLDEGARRAPGRADPATMNHFATRSP